MPAQGSRVRHPIPPRRSAAARASGIFRECPGLDSETEVIEHKSVDANGNADRAQGRPATLKWSNITLKRGVDESQDALELAQAGRRRQGPDNARMDGTIELLDYNGHARSRRYKFLQGWPIKYTGVEPQRRRATRSPSRRSRSATRASSVE